MKVRPQIIKKVKPSTDIVLRLVYFHFSLLQTGLSKVQNYLVIGFRKN